MRSRGTPARRATLTAMHAPEAPPNDTVEGWALRYISTTDLQEKLQPPPCPSRFAESFAPQRLATPGRPTALDVVAKTARSIGRDKLTQPRWRAHLLHTFLHHELQAAELMAWALLAFPEAPVAFRKGLVKICADELRHLQLYRREVERLGFAVGDFPVRDWFWLRVPHCRSPLQFVALLGIGLEGGNLDHAQRFAQWFRAVGDEQAAHVQEIVEREEVGHVEFAARWFQHWTGDLEFTRWCQELPPPLSPKLLRGLPLNRAARERAGLPAAFLDALAAS